MTTSINTDQYPFFSPGQILKHSDLNNLIAFLDKQNRDTRAYSIGMGVIGDQGLEPELTSTNDGKQCVKITAGVGLSSDGYLFPITDDCDFCYYKELIISENAFTSRDEEERYAVENLITVYELGESEEDGFRPIPSPNEEVKPSLSDICDEKVLALLWYREEVERTPCFNECDEKGSDRFVFFKAVLVDKSIFDDSGEGESTEDLGTTTIRIDDAPYIERLGLTNDKGQPFRGILDYISLHEAYRQICLEAIDRISAAYLNAANIVRPGGMPSDLAARLKTILNNFAAVNNNQPGKIAIQYFYDYLKDLILVFEEFADAACDVVDLRQGGLPDFDRHPGHIKLGLLKSTATNSQFDCRDQFIPSVLQSEKQNVDPLNRQKLDFLFNKMVRLVTEGTELFERRNDFEGIEFLLERKNTIKLTPSKGQDLSLSDRAIPFYYNNNKIRPIWNFRSTRKGHEHRIPSYNMGSDSVAPFNSLLSYDMDAYNFFRVEGYFGKTLDETKLQLSKLQKDLNLPFDIQYVRLESQVSFFESHLYQEFEDLQLLYEKAKGDFLCFLENEVKNHDNKKITAAVIAHFENLFDESIKDFARTGFANFRTSYNQLFPNPNNEYDCLFQIFTDLVVAYNKRISAQLFPIFAAEHPGLEHQAGVPKGGTLVIAYIDELSDSLQEELNNSNNNDIVKFLNSFFGRNINTQDELLNNIENRKRMEAQIKQRVVADFCLPYHCCGSPLTNAKPIVEPLILLVPRTFCEGDNKTYEITTYPSGGRLTATPTNADGAVPSIEKRGNKYFFLPLNAPAFKEEPLIIELTYTHDELTATQVVEIHKGPSVSVIPLDKREPIYDAANNCRLVGYRLFFEVKDFDNKVNQYAYSYNGIQKDITKSKFDIEVLFLDKETAGETDNILRVMVLDETDCGGKDEINIPKPCTILNEIIEKSGLKIDLNLAAGQKELFIGNPDEILVKATPAGGHITLSLEDSNSTFSIDSVGPCKDGEFMIDTSNLIPGVYTIQYGFPTCDQNAQDLTFELKEAPKPEGERKAEEAKDIAESADEKAKAAEEKAAAAEKKAAENEEKAKAAEEKAAENEKKILEAEKKIADLLALHEAKPKKEKIAASEKNTAEKEEQVKAPEKKATKKKKSIKMDTTILNKRLAKHQELMKSLGEDKNMAKTKSFGLAMSFVLLPGNDVTVLNARFNEAANSINSSIKRSSGDRATKYMELMTTLLHNFLDKQVVLQNEKLDDSTIALLTKVIQKLKALDFNLRKAKKEWKGTELKKALDAKVIDVISKMMK